MQKWMKLAVVVTVLAVAMGGMRTFAAADKQSAEKKCDKLFTKWDTNSDGKLSKEEFVAGHANAKDPAKLDKLFAKMDTDSDGSLTKAEFEAGMKQVEEKHKSK